MIIDSITLASGAKITNLVIANGAAFPSQPNIGEMFYKDNNGLYIYTDSGWERVAQSNEVSNSAASFYAQFVGPVAAVVGTQPYYPRDAINISSIFASLSGPAAEQVQAKVNVNGNQVQLINIPLGHTTSTTLVNLSIAQGDYITVDIVSGAGSNLSLRFDY